LDSNIHTIYHIKASDALSRRHWAADVSLIVFIVFGPARVRARKPPVSAEVRKCAVTAIVKQPAGCRRVYPETLVKGGEHWCRAKREDSFPVPHSQGPVTGRAEWGYFLSFLNPSRINASVEIAVLPADLNDFPGLIRTMDARNLPVSP